MTTTTRMEIIVNGSPEEVPEGITVADLLRRHDLDPETPGMAVAVNEEVVRRGQWAEYRLQAGDRVEIITATQGG